MTDDDVTPTEPGFTRGPPTPAPPRAPTPSGARRVPPNEAAPKVSARMERVIAVADTMSAAGYDALEAASEQVAELGNRFDRMADLISEGVVQVEVVVDESLVFKLEKLKDPK